TNDIGANGANRPAIVWVGGSIRNVNGSSSAPTYVFASHSDRGFWNDTTNSGIGWSTAGAQGGYLKKDGNGGHMYVMAPNGTTAGEFSADGSTNGRLLINAQANDGQIAIQRQGTGYAFFSSDGTVAGSELDIAGSFRVGSVGGGY